MPAYSQTNEIWTEFSDRIEANASIKPKHYADGTKGYVFYKNLDDESNVSKWLLNFDPRIYFSKLKLIDEPDEFETTLTPNESLFLMFSFDEVKPLSRIEAKQRRTKNRKEIPIFTATISAVRVEYAKDYVAKESNRIPMGIYVPAICTLGEEKGPGIFNLEYKDQGHDCFNNSNQKHYFLQSISNDFYGKVSCGEKQTDVCRVTTVFDLNRTAQVVINKEQFKNIRLLVQGVYDFLKSSTLAIDDVVLKVK